MTPSSDQEQHEYPYQPMSVKSGGSVPVPFDEPYPSDIPCKRILTAWARPSGQENYTWVDVTPERGTLHDLLFGDESYTTEELWQYVPEQAARLRRRGFTVRDEDFIVTELTHVNIFRAQPFTRYESAKQSFDPSAWRTNSAGNTSN